MPKLFIMGVKGNKMSRDTVLAAELLAEKLQSIDGIATKKMFGGHGVFHNGKMFGIVDSKGNYFFKVNDTNVSDYENLGAMKHSRMPYFAIPEDIFNDHDQLLVWAKKSIEVVK